METFDPDGIGIANGNYFGLPVDRQSADTVIVQVPWDATVSYGNGTSEGPEAIMDASLQVDLFDEKIAGVSGMKVWTMPQDGFISGMNCEARAKAEKVISALASGAVQDEVAEDTAFVNDASGKLNAYVEKVSAELLSEGKSVVLVGGEHSVPFGLIKALADRNDDFGILHIDAHSDTRKAYEGFEYSHASIMYNVSCRIPQVSRIVQVGIRDFCAAEHELVTSSGKFAVFTDFSIQKDLFSGKTWKEICNGIIAELPEKVYISFDIDGLSPDNCPGTGTPVPGGMSFAQADYLLYMLASSGKRIIGCDLCEVASGEYGEWDANVGARMLFKLLVYCGFSNGKFPIFVK